MLGILLGAVATPAGAQPPRLADGVGIRVTVADVRPELLEADLDLTMYTRVGPYGSSYAGVPTYGFPAIDYGDGSTVPSTTLFLAGTGTGPGGSNVYRNAASFTHTYPAPGQYTVTAASLCTACIQGNYTFLYPGGTPTSFGSSTIDYMPATVVGNLAGTTTSSGTMATPFGFYLVRFVMTYYQAVTNTGPVNLQAAPIPTSSSWGHLILGGGLLLLGVFLLHRTRAA